jgi:hypothetical protein
MFSTLLMGGGGHAREKDHQNVKSLIIFARDCRCDVTAKGASERLADFSIFHMAENLYIQITL